MSHLTVYLNCIRNTKNSLDGAMALFLTTLCRRAVISSTNEIFDFYCKFGF